MRELEALDSTLKQAYLVWFTSLTPEQSQALDDYKGAAALAINRYLREGGGPRTLAKAANSLREAPQGASAAYDLILHRVSAVRRQPYIDRSAPAASFAPGALSRHPFRCRWRGRSRMTKAAP